LARDLQFKLLTLVFAFVALLAISACAVASSPSGSPVNTEPESTQVPEAPSETEPTPTPEPTSTPETVVEANDDERDSEESARNQLDQDDSTETARDDDEADDAEEPAPGNPVRLQIDAIDVDAPFEYVGVDDQGNMGVPEEWDNVAWYEPGTVPGARGNSVIAGHYDSDTGPAVFFDLNHLEEGDEVRIVTEDGEELVFEIFEIESVHVDDADTSKIFGRTDQRNLNLITCEGVWDSSAGMYDHRLIVYTRLIES
jgi:sortase A